MFNLDVLELGNYYVGEYGWLVHNANRWCGNLISVGANDPAAEALAKRIGGQPSVKFAGDSVGQEFDVISDLVYCSVKASEFQAWKFFPLSSTSDIRGCNLYWTYTLLSL